MMYGVARMSKNGSGISGDNYTYSGSLPGQVIMSLSDGMGSGETAARRARKVIELLQQLLETGFSARSALKMVNTILLLTGWNSIRPRWICAVWTFAAVCWRP